MVLLVVFIVLIKHDLFFDAAFNLKNKNISKMKNNFIKTIILSILSIYCITLIVSCNNKREPTPLKVLEVHFTDNKVDTISIVTDAYSIDDNNDLNYYMTSFGFVTIAKNVKYVKPLKTNYGTAESD